MGIIARHQIRQMLGQRRLWLLGVFLLLPIVVSLLTSGDGQPYEHAMILFLMYPQAVCVLLSLLYGTAVISSEMEAQTLAYLFMRPIPRWHVIIGKYVATTMVLLVGVNVSFAIAWVAADSGAEGSLFASMGLSTSLSVVAYTAFFTMLGVIAPSKAMIVGVLAAMVEAALSLVPAVVNLLTISYYLRSLVYPDFKSSLPTNQADEITRALSRVIGDASTFEAIGALLLITAACLGIACYVVRRKVFIEQVEV
jgi:ABC-type transport system involved in multi-copper enzyme maturation permease subunit